VVACWRWRCVISRPRSLPTMPRHPDSSPLGLPPLCVVGNDGGTDGEAVRPGDGRPTLLPSAGLCLRSGMMRVCFAVGALALCICFFNQIKAPVFQLLFLSPLSATQVGRRRWTNSPDQVLVVVSSGSLVNKADEIRGARAGPRMGILDASLIQYSNTNSISIDSVFCTQCHSPDGISDASAPD
jgi:hypothetical protein